MKKTRYLLWILGTETVGAVSAFLSREGMMLYRETVVKPPLTPPALVFPVVWTILYALMGAGAARVSAEADSREKKQALNLFVIQLTVNFFWSLIFFNTGAYGFALIWLLFLWTLVLLMILRFRQVDSLAAVLQVPYLLWLTLAAYLSFGVWRLNS